MSFLSTSAHCSDKQCVIFVKCATVGGHDKDRWCRFSEGAERVCEERRNMDHAPSIPICLFMPLTLAPTTLPEGTLVAQLTVATMRAKVRMMSILAAWPGPTRAPSYHTSRSSAGKSSSHCVATEN